MEKKIKVLHVGEYVNGGVATYLKTLMEISEKYNIDTYLMMSRYKSDQNWNINSEKLFLYSYERNVLNVFYAMRIVHQNIREIDPNIIHVHSSWAGLFVRFPYLFIRRKAKIIYTPHGWSFLMETSYWKKKVYLWIEIFLSLVTDQIVNISEYEQKQAELHWFSRNKMVKIYNGISHDPIVESKTMNLMKQNSDKINLLFVGRLDKQKGLDLFLAVYYKHLFPNLHLYVIGKSIIDEKSYSSDEKTTYLGWVDHSSLNAWYQSCDAVIIPSRWEGFGLVAIEAMKNKKPIIASSRGALPELVRDGVNGYIFDIEKMEQLDQILIKLKKRDLKKMGNAGYRVFKKNFTANIFHEKMTSLYKSVL